MLEKFACSRKRDEKHIGEVGGEKAWRLIGRSVLGFIETGSQSGPDLENIWVYSNM